MRTHFLKRRALKAVIVVIIKGRPLAKLVFGMSLVVLVWIVRNISDSKFRQTQTKFGNLFGLLGFLVVDEFRNVIAVRFVGGIQVFQIVLVKESAHQKRPKGNKTRNDCRKDVPPRDKLGNPKGKNRQGDLDGGIRYHGRPLFHVFDHRDLRPRFRTDYHQGDSFPDLVPVHSANPQVQEYPKEASHWNPRNDPHEPQCRKH
mmetsp:Transcript_6147/g.12106  ORF Transcript_6147/g.12106 Transcript_6147/m.12106 type:complete len:202 (+) Transcript_6147:2-607(+)